MLKRLAIPASTPSTAFRKSDDRRSSYAELKALLIRHQFAPGEQLEVVALAKRFKTSTTPIREALNRLLGEGFLVLQPHRGFFAKRLSLREHTELYEFAYVLLRRAIEKSVDIPVATISATLDALVDFIANAADGAQDDVDFYATQVEEVVDTLVSFAGNEAMLTACRNFNERTHYVRVLHLQKPGQVRECTDELVGLIEKIRTRNVAAAIAVLDRRWEKKMELLPDLIKEAGSQHWI